jgi:hypothetical protein
MEAPTCAYVSSALIYMGQRTLAGECQVWVLTWPINTLSQLELDTFPVKHVIHVTSAKGCGRIEYQYTATIFDDMLIRTYICIYFH